MTKADELVAGDAFLWAGHIANVRKVDHAMAGSRPVVIFEISVPTLESVARVHYFSDEPVARVPEQRNPR